MEDRAGILPAVRAKTIDQVVRDYRSFIHPKKEVRSIHDCGKAEGGLAQLTETSWAGDMWASCAPTSPLVGATCQCGAISTTRYKTCSSSARECGKCSGV